MNLSPDQISALKKLISFKGYDEIDVQYEILDHVACRVEVLMEENPKLSLEEAFRKTHSEFGIFGFSDLEESYKKGIQKKFQSRYWAILRAFFTSYRVIYLFLLGWALNFISKNFTLFGEKLTAPGWGVIGLVITVIFFLIYYYRVGRQFKNYAVFKHAFSFMWGMHLILQLVFHGTKYLTGTQIPMEVSFEGIMAWITISAMAIGWISIFLLPKIIQEAAEETQKLKTIYES
ncbi:hypothetical protein SAMN03080617_00553 [Algoriphagus alkaliphilus]|uniref:Uncharacterized protein n=1 Tax=Algoriphagus alkaliphilus TaxID=279824 RepID=A0A1G5VLP6_9BACT|nr:hypothetical protein [Algoriphagus alkaliphilus]SDA46792.1 hypothetical protein SAMN03080617_00553 [Algoriphagus alkaliphilus]